MLHVLTNRRTAIAPKTKGIFRNELGGSLVQYALIFGLLAAFAAPVVSKIGNDVFPILSNQDSKLAAYGGGHWNDRDSDGNPSGGDTGEGDDNGRGDNDNGNGNSNAKGER